MILKNFAGHFLNSRTGYKAVNGTQHGNSQPWNTSYDAIYSYSLIGALNGRVLGYYTASNNQNYGSICVDVGFGTTPVTADDYNLADSNYSNRKLTFVSTVAGTKEANDIVNVTSIFRNDGTDDVTVTEIGVIMGCVDAASPTLYQSLIARKILDTPVVIAPGEQYSFGYRISN